MESLISACGLDCSVFHGIQKHATDVFPSKDQPFGPKKLCLIKYAPYSIAP